MYLVLFWALVLMTLMGAGAYTLVHFIVKYW